MELKLKSQLLEPKNLKANLRQLLKLMLLYKKTTRLVEHAQIFGNLYSLRVNSFAVKSQLRLTNKLWRFLMANCQALCFTPIFSAGLLKLLNSVLKCAHLGLRATI